MNDYYVELANQINPINIRGYFVMLEASTESILGGVLAPTVMEQLVVLFDTKLDIYCMKIDKAGVVKKVTCENGFSLSINGYLKKKYQVSGTSCYDGPYELVRTRADKDMPFNSNKSLLHYLSERRILK